ncbi:N-acetylmuramoyl-L-alanine amidase amiD precursor [Bartonella clarridgeiae 73]|uniref:N-acetylmuramoyl-L-alanine amidase n=1 Tax=Bartonella clarridgeiae (strain CCUG 45776 / CIP 104772 / 73) TaxID=696125 RepID=E6YI02_BARC7|nr:N-acetylmuramoyl-L-alanine amidase [Bartonella clarridgeiae]WCR54936.1 MAG: N-acetylmuramoyl-L-alanine amidase [Bartonella clarridgeiae]CBI76490.1 N-acetylmuramoyl-L-alanine amidase amiD precursor [Bartonella clarridgeiae 73]
MYKIDYNSYRNVKGFNSRVRFLVMHYTAANFKSSVTTLTGPSVSAHYLVPDPSEKTYIEAGFKDMHIFNLVDENERAWHAGVSSWAGRSNLNDTAIGIEIINLASNNNGQLIFPPFHPKQVDAIKELAFNILQRYPSITPTNVVGHNDISPGRKVDPGAAFPWKELYDAGIGAWYDVAKKDNYEKEFSKNPSSFEKAKKEVVSKLKKYGYDTSGADTGNGYKNLIMAFQLHFRQNNYNGVLDIETAAIIYALVEKYFPSK